MILSLVNPVKSGIGTEHFGNFDVPVFLVVLKEGGDDSRQGEGTARVRSGLELCPRHHGGNRMVPGEPVTGNGIVLLR